METKLTLVYSYFENRNMLKFQVGAWNSYSKKVKERLEVIVTDDCSRSKHAPEIPPVGFKFRLFRITEKVPWNWLEARNIGALNADSKWLLLTDMDHVLSPKSAERLFFHLDKLDDTMAYQFRRVVAPNMDSYKYHNDSFLVTKKIFWKSGGYDEDYSGLYGTSGMFRRRLFSAARKNAFVSPKIVLTLYPRTVIKDASTTVFPRKEGRDPQAIEKVRQWKNLESRPIQNFIRPYVEVPLNDN
jgi:hypothetical protein